MGKHNFLRRNQRKLTIWSIATLTGGIIGTFYSLFYGGTPAIAFSIGCVIFGGVLGFELFYVQHSSGSWLRSLPLLSFTALSTIVWTVIIALSLQVVPRFFGYEQAYGDQYNATTFRQDMLVSFGFAVMMNTLLRIRSLIGGRVLLNFLLGRYHRPLREQRVFLFIDIADSTHLSELLGDLEVQALISRFFFDIARPIAEHGGETHRYIGDEIVITWPLDNTTRDARCIECLFDIEDLIDARSAQYQSEFGAVPRFRAGMHGGSVVASEVGDDKREIVYFGDTINTAARLQSLCKQMKRRFLVSGELLDILKPPSRTQSEHMGEITLRGKSKSVAVYAISRNGQTLRGKSTD